MGSSLKRTFTKTTTYRIGSIIISIAIFILVWILSGHVVENESLLAAVRLLFAGGFGLDFICKSVWYFSHERLWKQTKWGKI